jgi:hypothetical protein
VPSDRPNARSGADLERVNAELRSSLEKCRTLLAECRSKLAANEDDAQPSAQVQQQKGPG